jgi:hypothetical protein
LKSIHTFVVLELLLFASSEYLIDILIFEVNKIVSVLSFPIIHECIRPVFEQVLDLLRILLQIRECPQLQPPFHSYVLSISVLVERALAE